MAYRYETPINELVAEILRCAFQDRESMIESLCSSEDMTKDDHEYLSECKAICRDIIKMDANKKLGVFGNNHANLLSKLSEKHSFTNDAESWENSEDVRRAKEALIRGSIDRASSKWPKQCMATTVAGKRCENIGNEHLSPSDRSLLLCRLHKDLLNSPSTIQDWPTEPHSASILNLVNG